MIVFYKFRYLKSYLNADRAYICFQSFYSLPVISPARNMLPNNTRNKKIKKWCTFLKHTTGGFESNTFRSGDSEQCGDPQIYCRVIFSFWAQKQSVYSISLQQDPPLYLHRPLNYIGLNSTDLMLVSPSHTPSSPSASSISEATAKSSQLIQRPWLDDVSLLL